MSQEAIEVTLIGSRLGIRVGDAAARRHADGSVQIVLGDLQGLKPGLNGGLTVRRNDDLSHLAADRSNDGGEHRLVGVVGQGEPAPQGDDDAQ